MKKATLLLPCAVVLAASQAPAQEPPGNDAPAAPPAAPAAPPSYPGALPPAGYNPDGHLGASSRSTNDISHSQDGFDFGNNRGSGGTAHGSSNGSFVVEGSFVPEAHTVRRGDTLWEISGRYYHTPYNWPRVWGMNPQIQNPHWIYPGDRVRLRDGGGPVLGQLGLAGTRRAVPPSTVFLRDVGWVDDRTEDTWGEVVGAPGDRMMLGEGDEIYVQLEGDHQMMVGEQLTIFRPIRTVESERTKGELVSIRGTARIDRYNTKTKMARAKIIESLDVIERGAKIGPVGRRFDVVPPAVADRDLEASIIASVYPYQVFGQNQVVFIDRGEKEGVKPGMRFFAIRRGDLWAQILPNAGTMAALRPRVEDDRPARVDKVELNQDAEKFPDETYAELRVLRVRDHTATALVVAAKHEIERNARLVMRKGL